MHGNINIINRFNSTSTEQNKILHFVEYPLLLNITDFMSQYKKDPKNHEIKNYSNGVEGNENSGSSECKNDNYNGSDSNNDGSSNDYNGDNSGDKINGGKVLQLFAVVVHLGMNICMYRYIYKLSCVDIYMSY
jgi:hypothetical protein